MSKKKMNKKNLKTAYDQLFKQDPIQANLFLLLVELADENGEIVLDNGPDGTPKDQLSDLMCARFENVEEYAL